MTTQEQLDQINSAITAIENGAQEYSAGDLRVKRADLSTLYNERRALMAQLGDENCSGGTYVAAFDRR